MGVPVKELDVSLRAYAPPWADVSKPLPERISGTNISRARKATGLDWEPEVEPQFRRRLIAGEGADAVYDYEEPKTPEGKQQFKYVTRGVGGPILDSANGSYQLFTNAEVFEVAEAIGLAGLELGRQVTFVAGGQINGGRKVFLMADLGARTIKGDPSPHVSYMALLNGHDGRAALKVIGTDQRWFCTNQIRAAELDAKARGVAFSFRHTAKIASRVEKSMDAIKATLFQIDTVDKATEQLLAVKVRPAQASAYIRQFALARVIEKSDPDRASTAAASHQRQQALDTVVGGISAAYGSRTCDGIRDTAYGLLAATVEFLDHHRAVTSPDALFTRTMIDTQPQKKLAIRTLRSEGII